MHRTLIYEQLVFVNSNNRNSRLKYTADEYCLFLNLQKTSVVMVYYSRFHSSVRSRLTTCRSLTNMVEEVLASKHGSCGVICLNNPSKLNALTLSMIEKISKSLVRMEADKDVSCILVKSNSPKAFCAGGDVQAVTKSVQNAGSYHKQFFYHVSVPSFG